MATTQAAQIEEEAQGQQATRAILDVLHSRTGCDFSGYRPATVYRRIRNRMIALGIASLPDYLLLLQRAEDETLRLLERLTIKVSRFYRNQATFDLLHCHLLPALARARGGTPLRIWSAGCGCGEEAYTLAMLLDDSGIPGEITASDIDPAALGAARAGRYSADALVELPGELALRYLESETVGGREYFRVHGALRARVRFAQHDLTSALPPPGAGRFDLVCCRNVLIYLQRDLQERTLQAVYRAVRPGGLLCLGEAEWPGTLARGSVAALGRKTHVFRVLPHGSQGDDA